MEHSELLFPFHGPLENLVPQSHGAGAGNVALITGAPPVLANSH